MSKAGTSRDRALPLRTVHAVIPEDDEEKRQLAEDLTTMGCEGLLAMPWSIKSVPMVMELLYDRTNEWDNTIRGIPEQWTADRWADTYHFKKEGRTKAPRTLSWVTEKFDSSISAKDGHAVSDCTDPRERRVLEFVVPILYPEKPGRVTKEVGNTIFGALAREYQVNWGGILQDIVMHQVGIVEKRKATYISPYLYHLYYAQDCLRENEREKMKLALDCLAYGLGDEEAPEEECGSSEKESARSEGRPRASSASPRMKNTRRNSEERGVGFKDNWSKDPFVRVQYELEQARNQFTEMDAVVKGASKLLGDCKASNICKELKKLKATDTAPLEAANRTLRTEVIELNQKLGKARDDIERIKMVKTDAVIEILELVKTPGDALNRAVLFNEFVSKGVPVNLVKMVEILRGFHNKMEAALGELRNMVPRLVQRMPQPQTEETTPAEEVQPEVRTTTPGSQKGKEVVGEGSFQEPAVPGEEFPLFKSPSVPKEKSPLVKTPGGQVAKSPSVPREFALLRPNIPIPGVKEIPSPSVPAAKPSTVPASTPSPATQQRRKDPTPSPKKRVLRRREPSSSSSGESSESVEEITPTQARRPETRAQKTSAGKNPLPPIFSSAQGSKREAKTARKEEGESKKQRKK
jgi:hypothetical protein